MKPAGDKAVSELRTMYVCQKCGDEADTGEMDHRGKHVNCGGQLDPNGYCPEDPEEQVEDGGKQR